MRRLGAMGCGTAGIWLFSVRMGRELTPNRNRGPHRQEIVQ
jgi:hypothetical protein